MHSPSPSLHVRDDALPPGVGSAPVAALRPLGAAEVVDSAIQLLRRSVRPLMVLAALTAAGRVPLKMLQLRLFPVGAINQSPEASDAAWLVLSMAPLALWHVFTGAAMVRTACELMVGRDGEPGAALRLAVTRFGSVLAAQVEAYARAFLVGAVAIVVIMVPVAVAISAGLWVELIGFGGMAAVGAATLAFLARYAVAVPAIVVEGHSARAALRRSLALTAGSRQRVFLLLFLMFAVTLVATTGTTYLLAAVVGNRAVSSVLNIVLWMPLPAVSACVTAVLYYDLRVRHEGFDIELMAERLSPGAPSAEPVA